MDADVAIVGFGPVGALLAGLLGKRGLRVAVIEKETQVFPLPRAAHIDHTGLRSIQELGCLEAILRNSVRNKRLDLLSADRQILMRIPADQDSVSGLPTSVYFYQPEFDGILRRVAASFPTVQVQLGVELVSMEQDANGVALRTLRTGGSKGAVRASWVIGCDGASSPVREMCGIGLESLNFDEPWLVLDLRLSGRHDALPVDHVMEVADPARPCLSTPIMEGRQRFEFMLLPGEKADEIRRPEAVRRLLEPWIPGDDYAIERSAVYTFHGLIARQWRKNRVFLAGDAAHQTPPFLGQGMCTGMRDAANLAWRLERVIRKNSPEMLLDGYEAERSPHSRKVIEAAIRIGKIVCELNPLAAADRNRRLLANDPKVRAELAFALPPLDAGPLVLAGGGALFIQPVVNGRLLDDIVGTRFFVLGRSDAALGESRNWWKSDAGAVVGTLADFPSTDLERWLDRHAADVVVVRPDRYVLGAARTLDSITPAVEAFLGATIQEATRS